MKKKQNYLMIGSKIGIVLFLLAGFCQGFFWNREVMK